MTENKIDALIKRVFHATGISSQSELAKELEINRSGITHARNNNKIPDKWIVNCIKIMDSIPNGLNQALAKLLSTQIHRVM